MPDQAELQTEARPLSVERVPPVPFGPGDLLWDLAGDRRADLAFLMPTLMQAMHPIIGDALSRMPVAIQDPYGRRERSVDSVQLWIYGGEQANVERRRLIELHTAVKGRDIDGREYSALKPEIWAWVPLSAYPAFIAQCRLFGTPLSPADTERLYGEVQNLARTLGVREQHIPPTTSAYWAYYDDMVENRLTNQPFVHTVLDRGRRLPLPPGVPTALYPAWRLVRPSIGAFLNWMTVGTFPPRVRAILELEWTPRDERRFRVVGQVIRRVAQVLPEQARYATMPLLARKIARAKAAGRPTAKLEGKLAAHLAVVQGRNTKSLQ